MRLSTITLFIVAAVGMIALMQLTMSGMAVEDINLKYYPSFFGPGFDARIIKGKIKSPEETMAANMLISWLPDQYELLRQALYEQGILQERLVLQDLQQKIVTQGEVDFTNTNAILIGSLCHNSDIAKLMGVIDCVSFFKPSEGLVKLIEADGHVYLIITGYSGDEVLAATRYFLSELQLGNLDSRELRIDSGTRVPLRNPEWQGDYTDSSEFQDFRKTHIFIQGEWVPLR